MTKKELKLAEAIARTNSKFRKKKLKIEEKKINLNYRKLLSEFGDKAYSCKSGLSFDKDPTVKTYLMKDRNSGLYKIGKSIKPKFREKTLQSEKPSIKMVKVWDSNIERKLHEIYHRDRIRGEWFSLNKIQVRYICTHF